MIPLNENALRRVADWLVACNGVVGRSAFNILRVGLGYPYNDSWYPMDKGDQERCLTLLGRVPELVPVIDHIRAIDPDNDAVWRELHREYRKQFVVGK